MARAPKPQEEDRRRVCREPRTPVGDRVRHVNRIKGLLSAQGVFGYEPLRKHRRERLEELRTGEGRPVPVHLKAQISRELDQLEVLLEQLKTARSGTGYLASAPMQTGMEPPSVSSAVSALRFFFAVTLGYRPDLAVRLTIMHRPRRLPAVLSAEEVAPLLQAARGAEV
jgi:transposase